MTSANIDLAVVLGQVPAGLNGSNTPDKMIGSSPNGDFLKLFENSLLGGFPLPAIKDDDPNSAALDQPISIFSLSAPMAQDQQVEALPDLMSANQDQPVGVLPDSAPTIAEQPAAILSNLTPIVQSEPVEAMPELTPIVSEPVVEVPSRAVQSNDNKLSGKESTELQGISGSLEMAAIIDPAILVLPVEELLMQKPDESAMTVLAQDNGGQEIQKGKGEFLLTAESPKTQTMPLMAQAFGLNFKEAIPGSIDLKQNDWNRFGLKQVNPERIDSGKLPQPSPLITETDLMPAVLGNEKTLIPDDILYRFPDMQNQSGKSSGDAILFKSDFKSVSDGSKILIPDQLLVNGLNLKEAQLFNIKPNSVIEAKNDDSTVAAIPKVSFFPKDWLFATKPAPKGKGEIMTDTGRKQSPGKLALPADSTPSSDDPIQPTKTGSKGIINDRVTLDGNDPELRPADDALATQSAQTTTKLSSENQPGTILSHNQGHDAVSSASEAESVRLVLPKELNAAGVKSGQTIILKMEPEHLGNVRLTLTTHQDSVTGRLVVDNAAARSMVQSNLDNLYDQLSRQGIRLDHFEVSLGGGQSGYKFDQSRSADEMKSKYRWKKTGEIEGELWQMPSISGNSRMYIGAAGVNWIA